MFCPEKYKNQEHRKFVLRHLKNILQQMQENMSLFSNPIY